MSSKMNEQIRRTFHNYLSLHIVLLAMSSVFAFTRLYKTADPNLIERISFRIDDPSYVRPGFNQTAIIGEHYFGDFQLYMAWASSDNPYSEIFAPNFLPLGYLLLKPLTILPTNYAFMIFCAFSLAILFSAVKSVISFTAPYLGLLEVLNVFLLLFVFTTATIVDFDRGNAHTLVLGLVIGGVSCRLWRNTALGVTLILAAASFKPYLFLVLILFCEKGDFKELLQKIVLYSFFTVVLYQILENNVLEAIRSNLNAIARYGNEEGMGYIFGSGSLVGAFYRYLEIAVGSQSAQDFMFANVFSIQVISALLALLGVLVWFQFSLPFSFRLFGLLSLTSVAQAGSASYQWGWVGLVLLLDLTMYEKSHVSGNFRRLFRYLLVTIVISALVPVWTWASLPSGTRWQNPQFFVLSPLVTLLNLILLLNISGTTTAFRLRRLK